MIFQQMRRRYGFLLRSKRDRRVYDFPNVKDMSPEEVDKELKLRFAHMIKTGEIKGIEITQPVVQEQRPEIKQEAKKEKQDVKSQKQFKPFKPNLVFKRS